MKKINTDKDGVANSVGEPIDVEIYKPIQNAASLLLVDDKLTWLFIDELPEDYLRFKGTLGNQG